MSDAPDLPALLDALDGKDVDYVIGGSVAAMAHGAPNIDPADLDVIPATDVPNLARLAGALDALEAEAGPDYGEWRVDPSGERVWVQDGVLRPTRPLDPADPTTFDHWFRSPHGQLDVVPEAAGSFDELRPRAGLLPLGGGLRLVASAADVLAGMTRPRREKDGPRVRHLRSVISMPAGTSGVGFIGFRTDRFDEMVTLFRDRIGLATIREADGATWFRLGSGAELHVYADTDPDHAFFTTGPVVGLRVPDVGTTRAALEADGLEMLTAIERTDDAAWCHFRAPDGTVLEIIGPPTGH